MWYRFGMCDQACACQSAVAVLLALYWRERTGRGQLVDTSIVNGGVYLSTDQWSGERAVRATPGRRGAGFRAAVPPVRDVRRVDCARVPRGAALGGADQGDPRPARRCAFLEPRRSWSSRRCADRRPGGQSVEGNVRGVVRRPRCGRGPGRDRGFRSSRRMAPRQRDGSAASSSSTSIRSTGGSDSSGTC